MATTTFIDLTPDDWTEVSDPTVTQGYISNITDTLITYVTADLKPTAGDVLGHKLTPHERLPFTLIAGNRIWMRSVITQGRIAFSPGIVFFECCDPPPDPNFVFQDGLNYVFQDDVNFEFN